jgi:hypothetical protein
MADESANRVPTNAKEALAILDLYGWVLIPEILEEKVKNCLANAIKRAYTVNRKIQVANGVSQGNDGSVHHLPLIDEVFIEFLENHFCNEILEEFFGGPYILNTFGGVLNLPNNLSYVGAIHRDQRTFSGELPLMGQLLVMLDDFTLDNGATYFLDGSHRMPEKPEEQNFFATASRAVGRAGSIVLFNSNIWHAAGVNYSDTPRRALTLAFSKPFIKQQLDYPRALGYERASKLSPNLLQMLGYNSRVPTSLDEWYQPLELRFYKRNQG